MATTRKQGTDDQNQDLNDNSTQQQNHAQTPDQQAANSGAFAQSSYQNTQQGGAANRDANSPHASQGGAADHNNIDNASSDSNNLLDTAMQAGKKWLDDSGVLNSANQLPQAAKEWGTKALDRVNGLSTTQKVVGGALLLAGVAFLSTRGKSKSYSSDDEDTDTSSSSKSGGYRQGSWAGYAGGKSGSRRNAESGSRSADVSSYGTERRASSSKGRSAGGSSSDTDFGSGRNSNSGSNIASRSASYGSSNRNEGGYTSGSSYDSGRDSSSASSPASDSSRGASSSLPNSNEQDYDITL